MSSAFHPQTDSASERTNKTVNQCLRYHAKRNQKGWVRALPWVRFDMMNSINASTGFYPFHLHMGRSPWLNPTLPGRSASSETVYTLESIRLLQDDVHEAQDNLIAAKASQAHHANALRGPEVQ
jgi:hypothetical protein